MGWNPFKAVTKAVQSVVAPISNVVKSVTHDVSSSVGNVVKPIVAPVVNALPKEIVQPVKQVTNQVGNIAGQVITDPVQAVKSSTQLASSTAGNILQNAANGVGSVIGGVTGGLANAVGGGAGGTGNYTNPPAPELPTGPTAEQIAYYNQKIADAQRLGQEGMEYVRNQFKNLEQQRKTSDASIGGERTWSMGAQGQRSIGGGMLQMPKGGASMVQNQNNALNQQKIGNIIGSMKNQFSIPNINKIKLTN